MNCPYCKKALSHDVNYDRCPECGKPILSSEVRAAAQKFVDGVGPGESVTVSSGGRSVTIHGKPDPSPVPAPNLPPTGENGAKNVDSGANGDLFPPVTPPVAVITGQEVDPDDPTREDLKEEMLRLRRRIRKVRRDKAIMMGGFKDTLKALELDCDAIINKLDDLDGVEVEDARETEEED
jgi:hypothetical protein